MGEIDWGDIHSADESWREKLIGGISAAYVMPRYIELFEAYLGKRGSLSLLELGAGNGEIATRIAEKKFPFISRYTTLEYFYQGAQWLKKQGFEALVADAQSIPFGSKSFDAVLSFDVMHHVADPARMGLEMLRTAKNTLFLTESNGLSLGRKLRELTPGHRKAGEKSYTPGQYRSFFSHPGYRITRFEISPFVFPIKVPASWLGSLIVFNRWMERAAFLRWQCSNVHIYVEFERVDER